MSSDTPCSEAPYEVHADVGKLIGLLARIGHTVAATAQNLAASRGGTPKTLLNILSVCLRRVFLCAAAICSQLSRLVTRRCDRFGLALIIVCLARCGGSTNLQAGASCKSSNECATGLVCDGGACRSACNLTTDCPTGNRCSAGLCTPLPNGVCGQAADCTTPPDSCHVADGAYCDNGSCQYPRSTITRCLEACETAATCTHPNECQVLESVTCQSGGCNYVPVAEGQTCDHDGIEGVCYQGLCNDCNQTLDCDPRNYGLDLCSAAACNDHSCIFTSVADCTRSDLAAVCTGNDGCKSGYCVDGVCCDTACDGICMQCTEATGHCDTVPDDDDACGVIDCDELDGDCRNYSDLTSATKHRCAELERCRMPNDPDECIAFTNLPKSTVCRASTGPCDLDDTCNGTGGCTSDAKVNSGSTCVGNDADDDPGVCDSSQTCYQLTTIGSAGRYFLEEAAITSARSDDFGTRNLTAVANGDVTITTATTGNGLSWNSETASTSYCSSSGLADTKTMTLELDFTLSTSTYDTDWIAGVGDASGLTTLGLAASHTASNTTQATLTGYYSGTAVTFTVDPRLSRIVAHLIYDSTASTATNRFRLYINGVAVTGTGTTPALNAVLTASSGQFCIGNTSSTPTSAFTGKLWYAAIYQGVPGGASITAASSRLQLSDKP